MCCFCLHIKMSFNKQYEEIICDYEHGTSLRNFIAVISTERLLSHDRPTPFFKCIIIISAFIFYSIMWKTSNLNVFNVYEHFCNIYFCFFIIQCSQDHKIIYNCKHFPLFFYQAVLFCFFFKRSSVVCVSVIFWWSVLSQMVCVSLM